MKSNARLALSLFLLWGATLVASGAASFQRNSPAVNGMRNDASTYATAPSRSDTALGAEHMNARRAPPPGRAGASRAASVIELAEGALSQRLQLLETDQRFPRSNDARDTLFPFAPDVADLTADNLALIERRATEGSDVALGAFLTMGAHLPDYRERSHNVLLQNAARGSVLALSTLADRAAGGYGFPSPDATASIYFEFLAWATGKWSGSSLDDEATFVPSFAEHWTQGECVQAVARARTVVEQYEAFSGRVIENINFCSRRAESAVASFER